MPWNYEQSTGRLYLNGTLVGTGYSGAGFTAETGRNNGAMENVADTGPIPTGRYSIGRPHRSARTGPHAMSLTPMGHNAHGRTAFQIHGNNATNNASNGCIILPRDVREQISGSGDSDLTVDP